MIDRNSFRKYRNDFSCVSFKNGLKTNYMKYVHKIDSYVRWMNNNSIPFDYINVYWRRNGIFYKRIYKNN